MLDGLHILIAEDELFIALTIAEAVSSAGGFVVGPVPTVLEALAAIARVQVDGAILDANLLDGTISPVVTVLRARGTPLVLHTGTGLPDDLRQFEEILSVVPKPAPLESVISALENVLKAKQ
jgi:CheY-like chemotaxis protein